MLAFGRSGACPQGPREKAMRRIAFTLAALLPLAGAPAYAQTVERLDPALDALVDMNTKVEILHQDDGAFFEGPIWQHGTHGQDLPFSGLVHNRIDKWDPATKQVSTFMADIWKGKDNAN